MKFQTKIFLITVSLVAVLMIVTGLFFNNYLVGRLETTAQRDIDSMASTVSAQFDENILSMEFISEHLLADDDMLTAMRTLSNPDRESIAYNYIRDAKITIRSAIITYPIQKNYYRVSFYNDNGDIISSNTVDADLSDGEVDFSGITGVQQPDSVDRGFILLAPRPDPWDTAGAQAVYSLTRCVQGNYSASYIEVQNLHSDLEAIYPLAEESSDRIVLIDGNGSIFFSQLSERQNKWMTRQLQSGLTVQNMLDGLNGYVVSHVYSDYSGIYTLVLRSDKDMQQIAGQVNLLTILFLIVTGVVAVVILYLSSNQLAKPIRQLTKQIQNTSLENMSFDYHLNNSNNDLKALSESHKQMLQRLQQSIQKENELRSLQTNAELKALQAQVNPHFIFNVLNVLSYKGMVNGDDSICTICSCLAGMLRYSTGTNKALVTVEEELEYLDMYLYLLAARYQDELQCHIEVPADVQKQKIPKAALQQLVENAANHGFCDFTGTMQISVEGSIHEGHWQITVRDNGCGFPEERLTQLQQKLDALQSRAQTDYVHLEESIGGLGLVNTYARILLTCGTSAKIILANNVQGGASVTIIAPIY